MPHRSRLAILLVDLPPEHHVAGRDFWSAATGRPAQPDATDQAWSSLGSFADGFHLEGQRPGGGPRRDGTSTSRPTTSTPRWPGWRAWAPGGWPTWAGSG